MSTFSIPSNKLPDNIQNYSWGGSLAKKTFQAYPKTHMVVFGIVMIFAGITAFVLSILLGNWNQALIAFPVASWLTTMFIPLLHNFMVREVFIIEPTDDEYDEGFQLNQAKWWKKSFNEVPASVAHVMKRSASYWFWNQGTKTIPLDVWDKDIKVIGGYSSAQIAGLKAYTDSLSQYAFRKSLTIQDAIKFGLLALIISVEIMAIYMLSGKVLRPNEYIQPQPVGEVISWQSHNESPVPVTSLGASWWGLSVSQPV